MDLPTADLLTLANRPQTGVAPTRAIFATADLIGAIRNRRSARAGGQPRYLRPGTPTDRYADADSAT